MKVVVVDNSMSKVLVLLPDGQYVKYMYVKYIQSYSLVIYTFPQNTKHVE